MDNLLEYADNVSRESPNCENTWNRLIREMDEANLASSTLQLLSIDNNHKPHVWGSGMLFRHLDSLYVFTALHNALLKTTTIQGPLVRRDNGLRMENRFCHGWCIVRDDEFVVNVSRGDPRLDFAFTKVPVNETYIRWSYDINDGLRTYPIHRFSFTDIIRCGDETVLASHKYAFCGTVSPCDPRTAIRILGADVISVKHLSVIGLEYVRMDDYYIYFSLPKDIASNLDYAGTSGAPIMSDDGRVIALVCGGEENDAVRGIRLDLVFKSCSRLNIEDLDEVRNDHMDELLSFLDQDQRTFYWDFVDKGLIV